MRSGRCARSRARASSLPSQRWPARCGGELYAYLDQAGITRGRADRATLNPALEALDRLERQIIETMRQLAMLPKQAADLALQLVRLQEKRRYDWSRLTPDEKATVDRLISKAETVAGGWPGE